MRFVRAVSQSVQESGDRVRPRLSQATGVVPALVPGVAAIRRFCRTGPRVAACLLVSRKTGTRSHPARAGCACQSSRTPVWAGNPVSTARMRCGHPPPVHRFPPAGACLPVPGDGVVVLRRTCDLMFRMLFVWFVLLSRCPHAGASPDAVPTDPTWRAPVSGSVVRAFEAPATRYGPGHRGVDLSAPSGSRIRAAAGGIVRFAGRVAGRPVLVLAHPDGLTSEYEPVVATVVVGQRVRPGAVIGRVDGRHSGCAQVCLHWGVRDGPAYVDPLSLLRPLGRVRLLPWNQALG